MSVSRSAGIGILMFALTGCLVHLPKYPKEWSPLHSADPAHCVDLTGTFENVGASDEEPHTRYLTRILFPQNY
jgi:hypothetical protein